MGLKLASRLQENKLPFAEKIKTYQAGQVGFKMIHTHTHTPSNVGVKGWGSCEDYLQRDGTVLPAACGSLIWCEWRCDEYKSAVESIQV